MGTVSPKELLKLWQLEKLTPEMAVGHIIQNLVHIQKAVDATNTAFFTLRADVDELVQHVGVNLSSTDQKKTRRKS
ncbi:MAG: hypothetical protein ACE5FD_08285 [Anaerolineae bacterium]